MKLSEISYDQIESLVVSADVDGNQVYATFALPGSDEIHEANAPIRRARDVGSNVNRQVKRTLVNELRRSASRLLRGIFGGGAVGRIARTTVNTASRDAASNAMRAPSKTEKENAIVDAFRKVASNFQYDAEKGSWVKPGLAGGLGAATPDVVLSPFEQKLKNNPLTNTFEQNVLARLLVQVAYADGELSEEEKSFFEDSIPESIGTLESLASSEPVSKLEAEEIPQPVRETIMMLAWTISSIDMETSDSEVKVLNDYAEKFGLSASSAAEVAKLAKTNVLEGYFTTDLSREELFGMADKIGLSHEDAERAKIRWFKRA